MILVLGMRPTLNLSFEALTSAEEVAPPSGKQMKRVWHARAHINARPLAPEASTRHSYATMSAQMAQFLWFDDHWRSYAIMGVVTIFCDDFVRAGHLTSQARAGGAFRASSFMSY